MGTTNLKYRKKTEQLSQAEIMVTVAKYAMGLLALLVISNASPLQGQQNLARNTAITGFHEDRNFVENSPFPEDKGQQPPLWARALERWIGPTKFLEERQIDPCGCWWCFGLCCCNG